MDFFRAHVLICGGSPCIGKGVRAVKERLIERLEASELSDEIRVVETGCLGPCELGPVMVIYPEGTMYCQVQVDDVAEIVEEHLLKGRTVERLLKKPDAEDRGIITYEDVDYYFGVQERIVLRNVGEINPEVIEESLVRDGYQALGTCLVEMEPGEVIDLIKESGLRGRGGAGFPTGLKWDFTASAEGDTKYIICNADEGEPGTFKDRLILEGDPHTIIEGMAIAGYATGACKGYIYIRGEYRQSIEIIEGAINQARDRGLLGEDIFGSGFSFDIEVREGAGAYICGEETALIESIEGKRGEPRIRPPYPPVSGLWGKPTVVNNVETLANVAPIIRNGAEWYRQFGTEDCPGTKVFTLTGNINNRGLIEVPMGITLREVIYDVGGGIPGGRDFKLAQTGGTSGGCLPREMLDLAMDYDTLQEAGSALGSGALLIIDESHHIVDVAISFMRFFRHESCGRCTPCREGTDRLVELLNTIKKGEGVYGDLELLRELAEVMQRASFCGLGQAAPKPLLTTIEYFEDEYEKLLAGEDAAVG